MNLLELKKQLRGNSFPNFMIWVGEERELMLDYIKSIPGEVIYCDTVSDCWRALTNKSLFTSEDNKVYIVTDDLDYKKQSKEWSKLGKISKGRLILIYSEYNKTCKMSKELGEHIVVFDKLTTAQLIPHVTHTISNISDYMARYLIETCNNDLGRLRNEMDKLVRLEYDISEDLIDSVVYYKEEFTPWELMDNILSKQYKRVLIGMDQLISVGDGNSVGFLSLLFGKFRDLTICLGYKNSPDIEKSTGVKKFAANKLLSLNKYTPNSCIKAMRILQDAEAGIKNGKYTVNQAINYAVLKILMLD